ncbi:MAG: YjfB family protein [Rhizobiales bacterium]|nr:YjfB family protein [Hyphomicrobiales bacterium]
MDMSLVTAAVGMMASNTQSQVATRVLKMNLDAQKQVLQLLAPAQNMPSANNAPGIGGNLDILA